LFNFNDSTVIFPALDPGIDWAEARKLYIEVFFKIPPPLEQCITTALNWFYMKYFRELAKG
jgi:hypothetical protein